MLDVIIFDKISSYYIAHLATNYVRIYDQGFFTSHVTEVEKQDYISEVDFKRFFLFVSPTLYNTCLYLIFVYVTCKSCKIKADFFRMVGSSSSSWVRIYIFLEYFKRTFGKKMQGFSMVLHISFSEKNRQFFKVFRGVKDIFVQLKI